MHGRRDPRGAWRNGSGKSTLLGIASGSVTPDGGVIEIMGKPLISADPLMARELGLATVYQDDLLVRELTVAQNLLLAAPDDALSYGAMNGWAREQLAAYDLVLAPDALVGDLTPAERQFLELVKALISRPEGAAARRADIDARSRRRQEARARSSAGSPPKARRSSMSATACPRFSTSPIA